MKEELNEADRQSLLEEYRKNVESFATIFDREKHDKLVERGERKLSHKAMWGALMIWLNRDEPRFHFVLSFSRHLFPLNLCPTLARVRRKVVEFTSRRKRR